MARRSGDLSICRNAVRRGGEEVPMITNHVTFVLLTEQRSQGRQTPERPVETGLTRALRAARARLSAISGFRPREHRIPPTPIGRRSSRCTTNCPTHRSSSSTAPSPSGWPSARKLDSAHWRSSRRPVRWPDTTSCRRPKPTCADAAAASAKPNGTTVRRSNSRPPIRSAGSDNVGSRRSVPEPADTLRPSAPLLHPKPN